jgi:hypothetical protein
MNPGQKGWEENQAHRLTRATLILWFLLASIPTLMGSPRGVQFCELVSSADQSIVSLQLPSETQDCYVLYGGREALPVTVLFHNQTGWEISPVGSILARPSGAVILALPEGIRLARVELGDPHHPEIARILGGLHSSGEPSPNPVENK